MGTSAIGSSTSDTERFGEELGYREMSTASVASVVAGLCSPLVLFGGVLFSLPVIAVALGLLAMRWVAADAEGRSGRGLALLGIALGVGSVAMAGGKGLVTPRLLTSQARPYAEAWFDNLRVGDLDAATVLTRPLYARPDSDSGDRPTREPIPVAWPQAAELQRWDGWSGVRFVEHVDQASLSGGRWQLTLRYELLGGEGSPRLAQIQLTRSPANAAKLASWQVSDMQLEVADGAR